MNRFDVGMLLMAAAAAVFFFAGCDDTESAVSGEKTSIEAENKVDRPELKEKKKNLWEADMAPKKVKLETTKGNIVIELDEKAAPLTVANFLQYVQSGFYDGIIFHRVIPGFMIQTGEFTLDGVQMIKRRPGATIKNEFGLSNVRGTVAMARIGGRPNSATSQFFISVADNKGLDQVDGGFTVFGRVVEGMEVADDISKVKRTTRQGRGDVPVEPVMINKAEVISE